MGKKEFKEKNEIKIKNKKDIGTPYMCFRTFHKLSAYDQYIKIAKDEYVYAKRLVQKHYAMQPNPAINPLNKTTLQT